MGIKYIHEIHDKAAEKVKQKQWDSRGEENAEKVPGRSRNMRQTFKDFNKVGVWKRGGRHRSSRDSLGK